MEKQLDYEEWTLRVSRLLELVQRNIAAIERHKVAGSPQMIVEQYKQLRDEHLAELDGLLKNTDIDVQLTTNQNAVYNEANTRRS